MICNHYALWESDSLDKKNTILAKICVQNDLKKRRLSQKHDQGRDMIETFIVVTGKYDYHVTMT